MSKQFNEKNKQHNRRQHWLLIFAIYVKMWLDLEMDILSEIYLLLNTPYGVLYFWNVDFSILFRLIILDGYLYASFGLVLSQQQARRGDIDLYYK